jgi:hypothetical protein
MSQSVFFYDEQNILFKKKIEGIIYKKTSKNVFHEIIGLNL